MRAEGRDSSVNDEFLTFRYNELLAEAEKMAKWAHEMMKCPEEWPMVLKETAAEQKLGNRPDLPRAVRNALIAAHLAICTRVNGERHRDCNQTPGTKRHWPKCGECGWDCPEALDIKNLGGTA